MPTISELTLGIFQDDPYTALDVALTLTDHPHARARIRDAAVKRLRAAALAPDRIVSSRPTPTAMADLPKVFVYTLNESDPDEFSDGPVVVERKLELAVHLIIAEEELGDISLEDALDGLAHVAEILLVNDTDDRRRALSGQASACVLGGTTIAFSDEGERTLIQAGITFRVAYKDEFAVPVGDQLEVVGVDWDLAGRDGVLEAQDLIRPPRIGTLRGTVSVHGDFQGTHGS